MIPSDLAARLRIMTEAAVQPLSAVRELASDLPSLSSGQRFSAEIQSALPDGTFRAIVAGRTVTLSLPHLAKAGDTLELVVIDRTPRAIIAAQTGLAFEAQAAPTAGATLSRAAQLIGALLSGNEAAQAAPLARSAPLLTAPPQTGRALAPLLQIAVGESGMFYESHQAQWLAGRLPLSALLREPQGQHSPLAQAATVGLAASGTEAAVPTALRLTAVPEASGRLSRGSTGRGSGSGPGSGRLAQHRGTAPGDRAGNAGGLGTAGPTATGRTGQSPCPVPGAGLAGSDNGLGNRGRDARAHCGRRG